MLHLTAVDDFDTDDVHQCKPSKNDGIPYIFISTQYIFCARSSTETILKMICSFAKVNNNNAINFGLVWLNLCFVIGARDFLFWYSGILYYSVYHITCSFVACHKKRHRLGRNLVITESTNSIDVLLVCLQHKLHQVPISTETLLSSSVKDLFLYC